MVDIRVRRQTVLSFVDRASLYNVENKTTWCTIYSWYVYESLHVSDDYVPIIRRNNYVFCDTWYLLVCVDDCLECRVDPAYQPDISLTVHHELTLY